jgi:integrase
MKAARLSANEWRAKRGYTLHASISDFEFADHLKPAVLLSLNTGMRRGELFGLLWADVSFEHSSLTVTADTAKDGETRHIPLNAEAITVLKQWKNQPGVKSKWVFQAAPTVNRSGMV